MTRFSCKGISFTRCLQLCIALLASMVVAFGFYVRAEKQIDAAYQQRHTTYALTDELRQSSDDLTRMVRSYLVTGDDSYLQHFQDIVDIRDGKKTRPQNYGSPYWDFIIAGQQPESSKEDHAVALLDRMKQAGFSVDELNKLTAAKIFSDTLAGTELKAIKLLQTAPANDKASREQAQMLLFDQNYHRQKAEIMKPIVEVIDLAEQRTRKAVIEATELARLIRQILIGLGLILLFLLWHCGKMFRATLGASPERIHQAITQLGAGNFDALPAEHSYPTNSVMNYLAQTQQQLQNLDNLRKQNLQSSQLAAKVFSDAQEGIFLTDSQGIVLDVNLAFQCITGYGRKESIGQYSLILKSDQYDPSVYAVLWESIKQEGRWRGEIWSRKKNGELFAGIFSLSAVNDNDGNLLCYLGMLIDITQIKLHQKEIEKIAFHDPLTQLPNRPLLADRMQQALARVDRAKDLVGIVCLDLDGFKAVNDTFGHGLGDALLIEVARRLQNCIRSGDTVARLGGDEFAILLGEIYSREHCEITLQRVLQGLIAPYNLCGQSITHISGSIGYTLFPEDNADPDTLLRHADHAMYAAKQAGKNCFHRFDIREDKRIQANWTALARIEKALQMHEFRLYIQPKIELRSGKVVGAEALIRWQHPIRGMVSPAEFLPLIEDTDIAIGIGEWVIHEALFLMQNWAAQGLILPLSINVGARQLRENDFCKHLSILLNKFPDVPPEQLEIEIVESAALDDMTKVSALIAECLNLGVTFALDDFGTGYSALTYLKRLSVTTLKIDQSFIHDLLDDENDLAIVRGVIGLAQAFNSHTVAEGVETWQQAACLLNLGCDIAQGYVIAHPMPANEVMAWIAQFQMPNLEGELP